MFGWTAVDIPMLASLPVLLMLSAFFSGSETALFALTETERMTLRRQASILGRAVDALLADQRMLLITILAGNMTVNVLYFVVTSVLLMKSRTGVVTGALLAVGFLVVIILAGEVIPKLLANSRRGRFAGFVATPLLTLHQLIAPLRVALESVVVDPLSRLTSPRHPPHRLDGEELAALFDMAEHRGVIDREEQLILQDVIKLSHLKVRDVMTPRVRISAIPDDADRGAIRELVAATRLKQFPVFRGDLDHIVGVVAARTALAEPGVSSVPTPSPVHFVPEVATLDQLLTHFRRTGTQLAVVVDEYGGTAGLVAIEDVVEELVGDIASVGERSQEHPRLIGPNRWEVGGNISVHDWAEAFGQALVSAQVATLGGLIFARLGRVPSPGDVVEIGNVRIEVDRVERSCVVSVIVSLADGESPPEGRSS